MVGVALFLLGIMKDRWDSSKPRGIPLPDQGVQVGRHGGHNHTGGVPGVLRCWSSIGVNVFLSKSATGTAMRAIANDRDVAALLGVPVRRVEAMAWLGSGILCGFVFLMLPSLFKSLDQGSLTWFVIGALGGAIVGQFKSLWVTFFASLAIGVIESVLAPFSGNSHHLQQAPKDDSLRCRRAGDPVDQP